jgi:hypothetical protein
VVHGPIKWERDELLPDVRRQDAALACATTVWNGTIPAVLPLTIAMPAIHGARLCADAGRFPRLSLFDNPVD